MKTLVLLLSVLVAPHSQASSEPQWSGNVFWKAPVPSKIGLTIFAQNKESLSKTCVGFEEAIRSMGDKPIREEVESLRIVGPSSGINYTVGFRVLPSPSMIAIRAAVEEGNSLVNAQTEKDILPFSSQPVANLSLFSNGSDARILITDSKNSMGAISAKVNLPASRIKVVGSDLFSETHPVTFVFEGLDAACDVLHGRASIAMLAGAEIALFSEKKDRLTAFYRELSQVTNEALKRKKSVAGRAASVALATEEVFSRAFPNGTQERVLAAIDEYVENFFDEKMTPSSAWYRSTEEAPSSLLVPSRQSVQIKLQLSTLEE